MIEKIKYFLLSAVRSKQMRVGCAAVLTALTIAVGTLLNGSVKTILISDGEQTYTVHTTNPNVASVVSTLKLKSDSFNIVSTHIKNGITTVNVEYTFPVYVTSGDKTTTVYMSKGTVNDALALAGYTPDAYDIVEPSSNVIITGTTYIDYTNIDYVSGSYTEAVPCSYETVYSSDYTEGTTKTLTAGSDGLQSVSYTAKFVNGVAAESNITGTTLLSAPVNGVTVVGTKKAAVKTSASVKCVSTLTPSSPIELDASGNPINYSSKMTVRATAYTYTGHNCATGVAPQPGYIAVNPNVIPYGTKMYIKSTDGRYIYGYAVAADTGGFIKNHPTGVDLFMSTQSACTSFGVRNVEIYILN